ncbi:MAG: hypothetical protein KAQ98_01530 [Bacteriovoracaceae bacterium]|nr:hypothetical protein [Bacteriovoracaceae bacterium]
MNNRKGMSIFFLESVMLFVIVAAAMTSINTYQQKDITIPIPNLFNVSSVIEKLNLKKVIVHNALQEQKLYTVDNAKETRKKVISKTIYNDVKDQKISPVKIINKIIKGPVLKNKSIQKCAIKKIKNIRINTKNNYEINNKELINLYGYQFVKNKVFKISHILKKIRIDGYGYSEYLSAAQARDDAAKVVKVFNQKTKSKELHALTSTTKRPAVDELHSIMSSTQKSRPDEIIAFDYSDKDSHQVKQSPFDIRSKRLSKDVKTDYSNDKLLKEFVQKSRPNIMALSSQKEKPQSPLSIQKISAITPAVKRVINRELAKGPTNSNAGYRTKGVPVSGHPVKVAKTDLNTVDFHSLAYSKLSSQPYKNLHQSEVVNKNSSIEKKHKRYYSTTHLTVNYAKFGTGHGHQLRNFEFVPSYNERDFKGDNGEGEIIINEIIHSSMSVLRGTLIKGNFVRTKIDLVLNDARYEINVPIFDHEEFSAFLEKNNVNGPGGFVLIELDHDVISTDLDAKYAHRILLNDRMNITTKNSEVYYVLYTGVQSGNVLISYQIIDGNISHKVVHVSEDEIYFDNSSFVDKGYETLTLNERNILGKTINELSISGNDIVYFNTKQTADTKGLNIYEMKLPLIPSGMRKYYELKHLEDSIFIGHWENSTLEIPSREFIDRIYELFDIGSIHGSCMLQINLPKRAFEVTIAGEANHGHMGVETLFLDNDGKIGDEIGELSETIFILGNQQGTVNAKIKYFDGSVEYLQSYCSLDTYLVEQL